MSEAAGAAFPAGMYFALVLLLSGLFFIGAWKGRRDLGLLLLAFSTLSMALASTAPYAFYVISAFQWAGISWFCSTLPLAATGWTLWYRLRGKLRPALLPVVGAATAAMRQITEKHGGQFTISCADGCFTAKATM